MFDAITRAILMITFASNIYFILTFVPALQKSREALRTEELGPRGRDFSLSDYWKSCGLLSLHLGSGLAILTLIVVGVPLLFPRVGVWIAIALAAIGFAGAVFSQRRYAKIERRLMPSP